MARRVIQVKNTEEELPQPSGYKYEGEELDLLISVQSNRCWTDTFWNPDNFQSVIERFPQHKFRLVTIEEE